MSTALVLMRPTLKPVKFTTRELRITREMTPHEFVRSIRGATAQIARGLGISHSAVSAVLRGKKRSARVEAAVGRWIREEIRKRRAA